MNINDYIKKYENDINGILLDVRTEEEYRQGYIKDALNIPLDNLSTANLDKSKTIYVYCRSGHRAGIATNILISKGYKAINIGGILEYKKD